MQNLIDWLVDLQVLEAGLQSTENANFVSISNGLENISRAVKTFDGVPNIGKIATTLNRIPPILAEYKEEDATVFSKCISSMGTALGTLPSSDKLKPLNGALRSLAKSLGAYKDVNVGKVNDVILNLNTALSYFKVDEASREISKICTQLNKLPARLDQFNSVDLTGFKKVTAEIEKMVTLMSKLNDVPNLKDFIASVKELSKGGGSTARLPLNVNKPEIEEVDIEVSKGISSVERLKEAFYRLREVIGESCKGALEKIKSLGRATLAVVGKIMSMLTAIPLKIGKMVVQRVLYRMVTYITNSVKEGINNFYQYSKVADSTFSKAMDRIATSSLYVKNSFGALVGTLIEKVTPYLEAVFDKISACVNKMSEFYARITGAESWTRAKKVPIEFAQATDNAVVSTERLKRAILGFDRLNILDFGTQLEKASKTKAPSVIKQYSTMFEEVRLVDNGSVSYMSGKFAGLFNALEKCKTSAGEFVDRLIPKGQLKDTMLDLALGTVEALVKAVGNVIDLLNKLHVPDIFISGLTAALAVVDGIADTIEVITDVIAHPKKFKENSKEYSKQINRLIKLTDTYSKFGTKQGYNDVQTKSLFAAANGVTAYENSGALKEVLDELEKRIGSGSNYKVATPTDDALLVGIENQLNDLLKLYLSQDKKRKPLMSFAEYEKARDNLLAKRSQRIEVLSTISRSNFNDAQTYNAAINGY